MIRRPPRSTLSSSSAASDVYKRQLEALAPHGLDENAELQLATAGDLHGVALLGLGDPQGDIALGFAQKAVANHAAGHLRALGPGKRRIVDPEGHGKGRRIDGMG